LLLRAADPLDWRTREVAAFQVVVSGQPQTLSPLLQDEIYRIAREVLRNAFRHAGAGRIEAAIQ